jgi:hypothetical protein
VKAVDDDHHGGTIPLRRSGAVSPSRVSRNLHGEAWDRVDRTLVKREHGL